MNQHPVIAAEHYDRIDGRRAYQSPLCRLTLGAPVQPEHAPVAVQLWQQDADGPPALAAELPIHQVMDLMIFVSRALLHLREAYRLPDLHDPAQPVLDRIGLQGDAMTVRVCTENPNLAAGLRAVSDALGGLDELTGERMRVLSRLLDEWNTL